MGTDGGFISIVCVFNNHENSLGHHEKNLPNATMYFLLSTEKGLKIKYFKPMGCCKCFNKLSCYWAYTSI